MGRKKYIKKVYGFLFNYNRISRFLFEKKTLANSLDTDQSVTAMSSLMVHTVHHSICTVTYVE